MMGDSRQHRHETEAGLERGAEGPGHAVWEGDRGGQGSGLTDALL